MHLSPEAAAQIRAEFDRLANLGQDELARWLETPESRKVGLVRRGETESVGHRAGRRILEIRAHDPDDLSEADYALMKQAIGYCRRHLAQRPRAERTGGDVSRTRWRWSLMNWGHDPLKPPRTP